MPENRFPCNSPGNGREMFAVETNRILDACKDRDCFENVRVFLTDCGSEIIEHTASVRVKGASIAWVYIGIDPVAFNRGFYTVTIRFFVKICFEACLGHGKAQEFEGIAVVEKRVILYGGECNVTVFKSQGIGDDFCAMPKPECPDRNVPTAIVEVVEPVLLGTKIMEKASDCNCCCCCCHESELPEAVLSSLDSPLMFDDDDNGKRFLTVSLGIFSVVRIVRPAQLLVNATEFSIPEKECHPVEEDDPCHVFRSMPFPVGEFCCNGISPNIPSDHHPTSSRCGCGN